jgi:hypothetical protein
MSSLPAGRSAALVAHDEALANLEEMLIRAGSAVGFWRPLVQELRACAWEIEDDVRLTRSLEDDE